MSASGYTGVWAKKIRRVNIRCTKKKKYITSGPRILLKFFGGFDFVNYDLIKLNFLGTAYENGVPMVEAWLIKMIYLPKFILRHLKIQREQNRKFRLLKVG